jgi:hypothetical protein
LEKSTSYDVLSLRNNLKVMDLSMSSIIISAESTMLNTCCILLQFCSVIVLVQVRVK